MAIGSNYYQYGTPRSNPGPNNYKIYSFPMQKAEMERNFHVYYKGYTQTNDKVETYLTLNPIIH